MAGIGFQLQKLIARDDLFGPARGYFYSAAVVAGPWILTVIAIAAISLWPADFGGADELALFRTVTLYNFSISLALSAPIAMIATRFLADRIYDGDESETTGALAAGFVLALAVQAPAPLVIYFLVAHIPPGLALLATANYFTVAALWVAIVFLSTLKAYGPAIFAFVAGLLVATISALALSRLGAAGLTAGFTAGLALTLFMLLGRTLGEFHAPFVWPRNFLRGFAGFPELALAALAYNAAIWVDKWLFWLSPQADMLKGLPAYPTYDGAMFYAHLTLAPGLAMFFALIETGFYRVYRRYYWLVQNHGTLGEIENAHAELRAEAARGGRTLLALHIAIAVVALLLAPVITGVLALMPGQIGIFRFGVLGTAAHAFFLYSLILLAYFDLRRRVLMLALAFFALNAIFTLASQQLGFPYFGAGYFLAALLSAAAAAAVAQREIGRLRYLTFIANNPATGRAL